MMRNLCVAVLFLSFFSSTVFALGGTPQEPNFTETIIASGSQLQQATALDWAPDGSGRLFVTLKSGVVRSVKNGSQTNWATISPLMTTGEAGLLGLCFDPEFATNGHVYFFVTIDYNRQQIIRYTDVNGTGQNKTVIMSDLPMGSGYHNGGAIGIGPDQKLYFALGDGGGAPPLNDISSLRSKVGRCNLDGSAPSDNPYYDSSNGITDTDYIWARGFRNPFSFTFDSATGNLWVSVVGAQKEQIFHVTKDSHAGWKDYEGNQPAGYLTPKVIYQTNGPIGGCVVGGTFYNGSMYPAEYQGNFFFGDYNKSILYRCTLDANQNVINMTPFVTNVKQYIDICVGPDGALYYMGRWHSEIYRLAYTPQTPQNLIVLPGTLLVGEGSSSTFTVKLAANPQGSYPVSIVRSSGSTDATVSPSTLNFNSTDWNTERTVTVTAQHDADTINDGATFTVSGTGVTSRNVVVTIDDDDQLNQAPIAVITSPQNGDVVSGLTAEFFGDGVDNNGTVRAEFYVDGQLQSSDINSSGHYHFDGGHSRWNTTEYAGGTHILKMTVFDAQGLSGSHEVIVIVENDADLVYQQVDSYPNLLSMEAEATNYKQGQGGHFWTLQSDSDASGEKGMKANPDLGAAVDNFLLANSPRMDYLVNFKATGVHYVWIRAKGNSSADSLHVGLNGQEMNSASNINGINSSWTWTSQRGGLFRATINVPSIGIHAVNLWMREDGITVDKIVLTKNSAFVPTGLGPEHSPRCGLLGLELLPLLALIFLFRLRKSVSDLFVGELDLDP